MALQTPSFSVLPDWSRYEQFGEHYQKLRENLNIFCGIFFGVWEVPEFENQDCNEINRTPFSSFFF